MSACFQLAQVQLHMIMSTFKNPTQAVPARPSLPQHTVALTIWSYLHRNTIPLVLVARLPPLGNATSHRDNTWDGFCSQQQLNTLSSEK